MSTDDRIHAIFPRLDDIPAEFRMQPIRQENYLVNGELRSWHGASLDVLSPLYVQSPEGLQRFVIGSCPDLGVKEVGEVVEAATAAYDRGRGEWPTMPVEGRIRQVENFVYQMKSKRSEIINILMWSIGKTLPDCEKEFDRTVQYVNDTIDALKDVDRVASKFRIEEGVIGQIRQAPLGVVLCMGPFNYPLNETFSLFIPALIMGNTIILRAPHQGSLVLYPLLELFASAFPKGVVNTLTGKSSVIVPPIMASGKVDVFAFIGSSQVANQLKQSHPQLHRLRSILGMDANNPAIILADADLDLAVKECVLGSLSFNGQRCTALKNLFVQREIADEFVKRFVQEIEKLKFGMPWEAGVTITPLPERGKPEQLKALVDDATDQGAQVVNPFGGAIEQSFFYPAVLYPVKESMKITQAEQFGPVVPITPFDDIEDLVEVLVNSQSGQQISIFSTSSGTVAHLVDQLINQVARININSQCQRGPDTFPFGGRKDSAQGILSVTEALYAFSLPTLVAAKKNDINKKIISEIVQERKSNFLSTDFIL